MDTPQRRSKVWLIVILVLAAVAGLLWFWHPWDQAGAPGDAGRPLVKVAANLPMTGDLGLYGAAIQRGAVLALEDLQKQDPTGPAIRFDWQDNTGDSQTTVNVMQRQLLQAPDLYTSALKPQVLAITDQISQKGLPHFTWILDIKINPKSTNNLRVWVNFDLESKVFLEYMRPRHPKRVAIVYSKTPAAEEEYGQVIAPALRREGATDFLVESLEPNTSDYSTLAAKINAFRPDMLILNGFVPQITSEVRSLRPFGLIKDGNTLASLDMLDAAPLLGPDEIEGIVVAAPDFLSRPDNPRVRDWKSRFAARFGTPPTYHSAYAYDMTLVIHDAAKRLQLPAASPQWIQAVRATQIEGVTGPVRFNDDGSSITHLEAAHFAGGKLLPLGQ